MNLSLLLFLPIALSATLPTFAAVKPVVYPFGGTDYRYEPLTDKVRGGNSEASCDTIQSYGLVMIAEVYSLPGLSGPVGFAQCRLEKDSRLAPNGEGFAFRVRSNRSDLKFQFLISTPESRRAGFEYEASFTAGLRDNLVPLRWTDFVPVRRGKQVISAPALQIADLTNFRWGFQLARGSQSAAIRGQAEPISFVLTVGDHFAKSEPVLH